MDAEKWLLRVRQLDAEITACTNERRRLREIASDITGKPYDGMPITRTGIPSDRVADAVIRICACEEELAAAILQYNEQRKEVRAVLRQLPPDEYKIMHLYYVMGWTWDEIAIREQVATITVWRKKKQALQRIGEILENKKEDGH